MAGKFFNAYYVYDFGKAKSRSIRVLPNKHQFGDLAHAKKAVEKHIGKKLTWKKDKQIETHYNLWNGYDKAGKWRGDIQEQRKNPVKKTRRKKKRSAKQLANDKRLGRMAKARAKKKRGKNPVTKRKPVKRKVMRRKVRRKILTGRPRRTPATRKKSTSQRHWIIFRCAGGRVFWEKGDGWTADKDKAIRFVQKKAASTYLNKFVIADSKAYFGVADSTANAQSIVNFCRKAAGK